MWKTCALKVLFSVAALGASGGVLACGLPRMQRGVKLPGVVERGVVVHDQFIAVTSAGKLIQTNLKSGKVIDLGAPAARLAPFVDVSGGKALVASPGQAHVVDLASGKVERSVPFRGESVFGLGLIGSQKAFIHTGPAVVLLDLTAGTTRTTIDIGSRRPADDGPCVAVCVRVGQRLYVANDSDNGLSIIDLDQGKLLHQVRVPAERVGGVSIVGDKAVVTGLGCFRMAYHAPLYYRVRLHTLGEIDLKTMKYTARKLGTTPLLLPQQACAPVTAPDGSLLLVDGQQVHRYESSGKLTALLPPRSPGRLVGFWNGSALVANGEVLKAVPLPRRNASSALWGTEAGR